MRIISGEFKGRRISPPKNLPVRPTTDMAKEALFNILNNRYYLDELSILDLFSGTGSIAYEFASRGTENIMVVDSNFECTNFIEKTVEEFNFPITVINSDVYRFLERTEQQFDIIFADPPYAFTDEEFSMIPKLVFENSILTKDGTLIVEHSKQTDLSALENFNESRNYGGNVFSFFQ